MSTLRMADVQRRLRSRRLMVRSAAPGSVGVRSPKRGAS
jgi:hypothetical protein